MRIDSDGRLGVGDFRGAAAQAKFAVSGDASITGDLRVGDGTDKLAVNTAPDATLTVQSHANNENVFVKFPNRKSYQDNTAHRRKCKKVFCKGVDQCS